MQVSPRFNSSEIAPRAQHSPKFGQLQLPTQALPELGIIPKLALPLLIGGMAYMIHSQSSKMTHHISEMLVLIKEGQEQAEKKGFINKVHRWGNTALGIFGLGAAGYTAHQLGKKVEDGGIKGLKEWKKVASSQLADAWLNNETNKIWHEWAAEPNKSWENARNAWPHAIDELKRRVQAQP